MTRIITLSVNENPVYAWFVPLCTLMWRQVAGFEVSCLFVGPLDPWIEAKCREVGTRVYACSPVIVGGAAAQLIRLFTYLAPGIEPDDYLLSVDADAWPLARAFEPSGAPIDLLYPACADHAETPYFPIGYIGAKAHAWCEFMGIGGASPEAGLEELYRTDPTLVAGHTGWNYDETLVTRKIKAWGGFRGARITKRPGDPPLDRIDRAGWVAHPQAKGHIDAHLLRPGWTEENWPRLRPLLEQCLTGESLAWADAYRAEWLARGGGA
jgi:hypothetical protein